MGKKRGFMKFNRVNIKTDSKSEWYKIIPIADVHLGNCNCDLLAFKNMVDWIQNKNNCLWVGMGDYIDAINYSDKRFDPKTIATKYLANGDIDKCIQMQIQDFVDIINPIKDKCIGLLRGNHEENIRQHYHYDVLYELAKELDLSRKLLLYDTAIIRLHFDRNKSNGSHCYDVFLAHGNVGGRTQGYKANRIHELHKFFQADIYLLAHSHIKLAQVNSLVYFNNRDVECIRKVIDAFTGCFLQGYRRDHTSYVEKWLYPPTDIGCVKLELKPENGDKHVSL
jgi:predicted phosphodiesterase